MNARERFIDYVKNGGDEPFVSLQIGAGAGFDCKLAGKKWVSETTIEDVIRAYEIVECEPLFNISLPEVGAVVPELAWQSSAKTDEKSKVNGKTPYVGMPGIPSMPPHAQTGENEIYREFNTSLQTPYGTIHWKMREQKLHGVTPIQYPVTVDTPNFFDIVCWYAEQHTKGLKYIGEPIQPILEKCHPHGAVSIQWNIQPFELMGLVSPEGTVLMAMLEPERYRKTCNLIRDINIELIREVFASGADFVFLGAYGADLFSPRIYEDFIIPDSQIITKAIHEVGGLVYSHICSPIEPFLSKGFYNRMGIDLFETLSPPPVGNVNDLAKAREILDPQICTRGNVGLDVLLNGTAEDVEIATMKVLEATQNYKHMVAASDYLFYDVPLENVKAMVITAKNYQNAKGLV